MIRELSRLKHAEPSAKINYLLSPVSIFDATPEGAEEFNKIYFWLKEQKLNIIERTPSGAIKSGPHRRRPAWDIRITKTCVEITALLLEGAWRIQFRSKLPKRMSGRKAFTLFKRILKKRGIDLETYAIENGKEVKETIEN